MSKDDLRSYLDGARDVLVWKLEGLSEYDTRRPLTPTGTNLLGLVKHSTSSHRNYFGIVFGRGDAPATGSGSQFLVKPEETREAIVANFREACRAADQTISELPLDTIGHVPWWGSAPVTLHHVIVHVIADTQRHAGHADILREMLDGAAGLLPEVDNLHQRDPDDRRRFRDDVEAAANHFR